MFRFAGNGLGCENAIHIFCLNVACLADSCIANKFNERKYSVQDVYFLYVYFMAIVGARYALTDASRYTVQLGQLYTPSTEL
jgi:hypothetical protein